MWVFFIFLHYFFLFYSGGIFSFCLKDFGTSDKEEAFVSKACISAPSIEKDYFPKYFNFLIISNNPGF